MLESTQNLLLVSKDEVKVQKLQEAIKTHQSNLDRIQEQLEEAKSKKRKSLGSWGPLFLAYCVSLHPQS